MATLRLQDSEEELSTCSEELPNYDYDFVEKPSEDFFCPVTLEVLRDPFLTVCCGNHLSQEAAYQLQQDQKPCPLCKQPLQAVPDKYFQRIATSEAGSVVIEPKEARLEEDEVDLRAYRPAGGPIILHALELPPQPKTINNWTIMKGGCGTLCVVW